MSKKSTKPTYRSFERLLKAEDVQQITDAVIACCWEAEGNEGKPPTVTPDHLQELRTSPQYFDVAFLRHVVPVHDNYFFLVDNDTEVVERFRSELSPLEIDAFNLAKTFLRLTPHQTQLVSILPKLNFSRRLLTDYFLSQADHPLQAWIDKSHQGWIIDRGDDPKLPHPLAPIVREWLKEQIPTVEPARRKDTGILHHAIGETHHAPRLRMTVMDTVPGKPEQTMLITNLPQGDLQLELPGFEFPESELVPALPLEAYETVGGRPSQTGRGAPISQRLFFNILVEYAQKQRGLYGTSRLNTNYRDVKSWLYPQGTKEPKNRLIPRIYKGMYELHNLRFLWERRAWNIISVDSLPTMAIRPDDPLTFTVRMPAGMNTKNGALIGIEPMRIYGAQSAPKFRAWVRLAYLWDAAKIRNGGRRIYATVPGVLRNSDGYLVDAKGEVILTGDLYPTKGGWKYRNGSQPQKAWYHPLAIQTGEQVRNPQADKVPVLSDGDMVKLFYDHTERKGEAFRNCLKLARQYALNMQDDGRVVVEQDQTNEKTGDKGWRILEKYR